MGRRGLIGRTVAQPAARSGLATPEKWVEDWFSGGGQTAAGVQVSEETALHYSPFFAGVNAISSDIGKLPLPLYERLEPRGKRRAREHPLYPVLHDQANDLMGAMVFRRTVTGHALTWGTGYAYVDWTDAGTVAGLWPLRPDRIRPDVVHTGRGKMTVTWIYQDPGLGISTRLFRDEVLPVGGLGYDGLRGYSVVAMARQSIGLGLAAERYGASFFANGSRPGGVLKTPKSFRDDKARERLKTDWENLHKGLDRAQRIAILEEGMEWQQIGIPPEDAQFLETRRFGVEDMARWLRLPPHKIAHLERSTNNNIEHQALEYVTDTLQSWLVGWEQAIQMRLLTTLEKPRFFAEHLVAGLLRGDLKTRYEAYAIGRNWGWWSADDVRELENANPLPDGKGQEYLQPLNMVPVTAGAVEAPRRCPVHPGCTCQGGQQLDND